MAIEMQFMVRVEPVLSVRLGHDWPGGASTSSEPGQESAASFWDTL